MNIIAVPDKGGEFLSKQFLKLCSDFGCKIYYSKVSKPGTIERFNRTLQSIIYRYCTEKQTFKFYDKLQLFINQYNNRYAFQIHLNILVMNKKTHYHL